MAYVICSSTTRPSSPDLGQTIYEVDTKSFLSWQKDEWWEMLTHDDN